MPKNHHFKKDEEGEIPSPFPYMNPESDEWKGLDDDFFGDEPDEDEESDFGGMRVY